MWIENTQNHALEVLICGKKILEKSRRIIHVAMTICAITMGFAGNVFLSEDLAKSNCLCYNDKKERRLENGIE